MVPQHEVQMIMIDLSIWIQDENTWVAWRPNFGQDESGSRYVVGWVAGDAPGEVAIVWKDINVWDKERAS